jgi:hypothetical protein
MNERQNAHYLAFLPIFGRMLSGAAIVLMTMIVICSGVVIELEALESLGIGVVLMVGVVWFLTRMIISTLPLYVSDVGLTWCYGFWGFYRTVPWGIMRSVHPRATLGLRFLMVNAAGNGKLFVPLFLSNGARFRENVREFAGNENPLVRALDAVIDGRCHDQSAPGAPSN